MNIVVILNISSFLSLVAFARLPEAKIDFFVSKFLFQLLLIIRVIQGGCAVHLTEFGSGWN